ncbi:hypothetical protein PGK32_18665 [Acinetobacter baumannii]|nr:hypothetical protein [Acinetobacter baumannii]
MAVAHTTLLEFLGKHIKYQVAVDTSFDESGFVEESGFVTGVLFEVNGDCQFCVKIDGYDYEEFILFSKMKLLN